MEVRYFIEPCAYGAIILYNLIRRGITDKRFSMKTIQPCLKLLLTLNRPLRALILKKVLIELGLGRIIV